MSESRPPRRRAAPLGWLGWSIILFVIVSMVSPVFAQFYGERLRSTSPGAAVAATGQVIDAVMTSRRGPEGPHFFITWWQSALWDVLSFFFVAPLVAALGFGVWFSAWRRRRP